VAGAREPFFVYEAVNQTLAEAFASAYSTGLGLKGYRVLLEKA
jgi:hypothetical protein